MTRRLAAAAVALGVFMCAAPASSSADVETLKKTVDAKIVFEYGANPARPGNCSAVAFAEWKDVPGTKSALATTVTAAGKKIEVTASAPDFHDYNHTAREYFAPPGSHRIIIGAGWGDGPKPNDCGLTSLKQRESLINPVTVELTFEGEPPELEGFGRDQKLDFEQRANIVSVTCPAGGSCDIEYPKLIHIKLKRKRYPVRVVGQKRLKGGETGRIQVFFPVPTMRAFKGRKVHVFVDVKATNEDIFTAEGEYHAFVKMPAKI
jgi:hypothetical protein